MTKAKRDFQFYRNGDFPTLMVVVEPGRSINIELAKRLGFLTAAEVEEAEKKVPRR